MQRNKNQAFVTQNNPAAWWDNLPVYWKKAFNEAVLGREAVESAPSDEDLGRLRKNTVLRFSGPGAPFPNMSFELPNLAGVEQLNRLDILVVTFHHLVSLRGIERLTSLKSLFLYNNRIEDLTGLEKLTELEELYIQNNSIRSLEPLQHLKKLRVVYCSGNALTTLGGITAAHTKTLRKLHCLPNDHLPDKELLRVENRLGIRCLRG